MAKNIEPTLRTIGVYLNNLKTGYSFRIPEYQRGYSWNIFNCEKLWQDIENYLAQKEDDPYFFGTIIVDCSQEGILNLIDGQQRITTFLLLLKVMQLRINYTLDTMASSPDAEWLRRSLQQSLDTLYEILYRADVRKQLEIKKDWNVAKGAKILENASINELHRDDLNTIIDARTFEDAERNVFRYYKKQKDNKYTNFFRNFKYFHDRLSTYNESRLDEFAKGVLEKCQVIEIKSWQIEQAITMFNSLNSTGLPLSDADIISAKLFVNTKGEIERESRFKDLWEPIKRRSDELGQKKIVTIDGILQQFMYIDRAKDGQNSVQTPGLRKYYTEIKTKLLEDPIELCKNLDVILDSWETIQDYPITKLLLKFNENFKLFLISYLFRMPKNELSQENITPIMECFLRLFALLEVGQRVFSTQEFKTFLFNENLKLADPNCSAESIVVDFNNHIQKTWKREEVMEELREYRKNILVYLNEYLYAKEHDILLDFSLDQANVEHIMPRSGSNIEAIRKDAKMEQDEFEEKVNQLGNKILLEEDINKQIGRDWFVTKKSSSVKKKKGYIDSKFGLATALASYPSEYWTGEDIDKTTDKAASRICDFIFGDTPIV